jgi:hypothetical protein
MPKTRKSLPAKTGRVGKNSKPEETPSSIVCVCLVPLDGRARLERVVVIVLALLALARLAIQTVNTPRCSP